MPLSILVIDADRSAVRPLVERLAQLGHRVETAGAGQDALARLVNARSGGRAFDLAFCALDLPDLDGVALLRELRRWQDRLPVALHTRLAELAPETFQEAERLGCALFLDLPIDLGRAQHFAQHVAELAGRSDAPFAARTPNALAAGERPGTASHPPPPGHQPSTTQRIRRSVTGRVTRGEAGRAAEFQTGRTVRCAGCRQAFVVPARNAAFTVVCVHCGHQHQVDPA